MADEYIRLDTTIIEIDNLINEAATGSIARALFNAKDVIYRQQRYVIDVQPVRRGRWIISSDGYYPYCSECKERPEGKPTKFCSNCGARMDGDTE